MAKRKKKSKKLKKVEEEVKTYQLVCEDCGKTKISFRKIAATHIYCNTCVLKDSRLKQKGVLFFR